MGLAELILISVGLAMDAFSVSVCKGLSMKKLDLKGGVITALFFGVFQAVMPVIGYFLGSRFANIISSFSHWVSFLLLAFIGGKMIWEAVKGDDEDESGKELYRYAPQHSYDHVVISTPLLEKGKTYRAYAGDGGEGSSFTFTVSEMTTCLGPQNFMDQFE